MSLGAFNDFMEHSEEERERLHKQALANYDAWIKDRERRQREYNARVDAYHRSLPNYRPPCNCPCCRKRRGE